MSGFMIKAQSPQQQNPLKMLLHSQVTCRQAFLHGFVFVELMSSLTCTNKNCFTIISHPKRYFTLSAFTIYFTVHA
ncbi:hypothetical protein BRADI_2g58562v3 [Brachypodium distachyon]|uniref:Uncharacterized protein n=1 Tax=Brachypodium distachyon TaxID=15368 RepID=A0A2K2DGN2_BRADI|nr:hypothetical protein BRADI_2g58562v3 [Brachypodium distachyon]